MKFAQWVKYPGESDEDSPLFALTVDIGTVLWETDSPPTARGNRELEREWDVKILAVVADGGKPFDVQP